jgi:hypothetical protein
VAGGSAAFVGVTACVAANAAGAEPGLVAVDAAATAFTSPCARSAYPTKKIFCTKPVAKEEQKRLR